VSLIEQRGSFIKKKLIQFDKNKGKKCFLKPNLLRGY